MIKNKAYQLFHEGNLALSKASRVGFRLDVEYCKRTINKITEEVKTLEQELLDTKFVKRWKIIYKEKFNLNSGHQLGQMLYKIYKLEPPELTETGKGSTNDSSLTKINRPELKIVLRIRKLKKIRDTYLENYLREQVDGILHPTFNLNNVISYRGSCSNPNLTNVSKNNEETKKYVRSALMPHKDQQLMEVDYKNLEVFIACCLHQDPTMIEYLQNPKADMHTDMSEQIYMMDINKRNPIHDKLRFFSKGNWTFGQAYGDYYVNCARGFCKDLNLPIGKWSTKDGIEIEEGKTIGQHYIEKGIKSYKDFENFLKKVEDDYWGRRFAVYGKWRENLWETYKKKGYITGPTGFTYRGIMKRKNAINYPVQGAAFHVLLWSFIQLTRIIEEKNLKSKLISQVHDSIILSIEPSEIDIVKKIIRQVMTVDVLTEFKWLTLSLDIDAELGDVNKSWYELEHTKI